MMVQQSISEDLNQLKLGRVYKTLIEDRVDDSLLIGRTQCDAEDIDSVVYVETREDIEIGDMVDVEIESAYEYDLKGRIKK